MDANDRKVIDVLSDQKRFIVPFYQRHYKWGESLWSSFWDDVCSKAQESLTGAPKFDHYMGALILSPESYSIAVTPRLLIVDGQQRLITFQLFLASMCEVGDVLGYPEIKESIANYLFNKPMSGDIDYHAKFKLTPNRADRTIFYKLLDEGLKSVRKQEPNWFFQNGRIIKKYAFNSVQAVYFFKNNIEQYAKTGIVESIEDDKATHSSYHDNESDAVLQRLQALMDALLNHVKLVVISLGDEDDAQSYIRNAE